MRAPSTIQLLPAGEFQGRDGRPGNGLTWKLPDARGRDLCAMLNARHATVRFNMDYEHQAMLSDKNGKPAPASGWGSRFAWRDGEGLFLIDVLWTDRATQMIEAGEYLYLSPVIAFNKTTGAVLDVINAALTNIPALMLGPLGDDFMDRQSANSTSHVKGDGMDNMRLNEVELVVCRATGVSTQEFIATRNGVADADLAVSRALGMRPDEFMSMKGGANVFARVGIEGLDEAELTVCRMTGVSPEEFIATKYGDKALGRQRLDSLTDAELSVCRLMGMRPEDFLAMREEEIGQFARRATGR